MTTIPESIAVDARAKVFWGERADKVMEFLASKGVEREVGRAFLQEVLDEKLVDTRSEGRTRIWKGAGLILIPVAYYVVVQLTGYLFVKLFAVLLVVGAYGLFVLTKGIGMATQRRESVPPLNPTEPATAAQSPAPAP
jgi:hypothetical protein